MIQTKLTRKIEDLAYFHIGLTFGMTHLLANYVIIGPKLVKAMPKRPIHTRLPISLTSSLAISEL